VPDRPHTPQDDEDLGVVDVLVVELPPTWEGGGLEPLLDLAARGAVRIIDVEVLVRRDDGTVGFEEPGSGAAAAVSGLSVFFGHSSGLLGEQHAADAAALVAEEAVGLVVVYENLWTSALAGALRRVGGRLADAGRLDRATLETVLDDIRDPGSVPGAEHPEA
jgi:hypothetical protein